MVWFTMPNLGFGIIYLYAAYIEIRSDYIGFLNKGIGDAHVDEEMSTDSILLAEMMIINATKKQSKYDERVSDGR